VIKDEGAATSMKIFNRLSPVLADAFNQIIVKYIKKLMRKYLLL